MADVIIIGDGPGGLSAALFLSKKKMVVTVYGKNETPMHAAMLWNYLGIEEMTGTDFQNLARKQVQSFGTKLVDEEVTAVAKTDAGFKVTSASGSKEAKYLIVAAGHGPALVESLGVKLTDKKVIDADRNGRTAVKGLYAAGWSVRPDKIQAIISAGDGAAAALDILSAEGGKDIHDFDVPPGK